MLQWEPMKTDVDDWQVWTEQSLKWECEDHNDEVCVCVCAHNTGRHKIFKMTASALCPFMGPAPHFGNHCLGMLPSFQPLQIYSQPSPELWPRHQHQPNLCFSLNNSNMTQRSSRTQRSQGSEGSRRPAPGLCSLTANQAGHYVRGQDRDQDHVFGPMMTMM